ncbi:hypothetical protein [Comamonas sp.]|uniref:hypothetical protein n=1 Tax=Comamonas sp. TaxID=34028 RepID=UPI0012CEFFB4|nr:hypothetical protein [Comamonas sp.]MPS93334.1 hypothetical protein [Comamonas sp.]
MNLSERKMILRVFQALDAVPGAYIGGGTQSVTVAGAISFGADMQTVRSHCSKALIFLLDGGISQKERDECFDSEMKAVERFIEARRADDWSTHTQRAAQAQKGE